ncbi:MAG: class I SAM-dependent methyltransferase [Candidatus Heimdallarchaeota archaeon]|nr:class I SAM-dependent methyltransferase [Candidatus Heimdallarchaeota archaeon]
MKDRLLKKIRTLPKKLREKLFFSKLTHKQALTYWSEPNDGSNKPEGYLQLEKTKRSQLLLKLLEIADIPKNAKILELGPNACRNLNFLYNNEYVNLFGIEISENALDLAKKSFPSQINKITLLNAPVESILPLFFTKFDVIFTMAVLEHIHTKASKEIFKHISKLTNILITIEDEFGVSERHFPRNYQKIFESLGFNQIHVEEDVTNHHFNKSFRARIFVKKEHT